jgi:hypothetical protein
MLEMIEKHLDGDTGSSKARRAAHPPGVNPDDLVELGFWFRCHVSNLRECRLDYVLGFLPLAGCFHAFA